MDASCTVCSRRAPLGNWRCVCGGTLDLPEIPANALRELSPDVEGEIPANALTKLTSATFASKRFGRLWRYRACIPVSDRTAAALSMGEGQTPLIAAGEDLPDVALKLEFISPTLSFKDRGAVVLVAGALERGASSLVADSSGNAGSAIAAYAARARLECKVFVPKRTSARKQAQIRAYGAEVEEVAGDRTSASDRAIAAVERTGATYASHVYDPLFIQGTKTFAYEVWEQLQGAPDALLLPVGNGTLLLGAARGFRELRAAGLIDRLPALIGLQSERCDPIARAWSRGAAEPVGTHGGPTKAEGIAVPRPPRGAQILVAVHDSGGCVVRVPEAAIAPAQRELAGRGVFVEPTAALTWAATLLVREHPSAGAFEVDDEQWSMARALAAGTLLVPLCGAGLKH